MPQYMSEMFCSRDDEDTSASRVKDPMADPVHWHKTSHHINSADSTARENLDTAHHMILIEDSAAVHRHRNLGKEMNGSLRS